MEYFFFLLEDTWSASSGLQLINIQEHHIVSPCISVLELKFEERIYFRLLEG